MVKYAINQHDVVKDINIKDFTDGMGFENPKTARGRKIAKKDRQIKPSMSHLFEAHEKSLKLVTDFMGYEGTVIKMKNNKLSSPYGIPLNNRYSIPLKYNQAEKRSEMIYFHNIPDGIGLKVDFATKTVKKNKNKWFNRYDTNYNVMETVDIKNGTTISINNNVSYRIYLNDKDKYKDVKADIEIIWFSFINFRDNDKDKDKDKTPKRNSKRKSSENKKTTKRRNSRGKSSGSRKKQKGGYSKLKTQ